ncbi:phage tail tape measure protein [Rodentibacter haemolyticus]|uniref:Phage tail tape measure protein n=1 Tax=Rodentibacter haemolyticus TaxID=2778911 RepID=A0ABX6V489_9PAST|nr:phage tail tape measure protein [Rodentibacter haemolyticus]QPB43071.1 phage tail tape measure protein [Rodentibacter haemolyticus]
MAIQGLEYIISLTDQLSAPLKGVMKTIDQLGKRGEDAMKRIGIGAAGIIATGASLKHALDPAIEFSRAMNEVKATGMGAEGLAEVEKFALDFSSTFGIASNEVVSSVNEIARAIDGLTDKEMIAFSESANILAKATGSNTAQMGSYIATMSNIFQDEMNRLGKSDWVKQMAGQATLTANMFKSSGESLSAAFSNLGSAAKNAGVSMAEQFAILGNTQGIMDGAKSGTAYRALIENAINSTKMQKKLGMTFVDQKGLLLPITEIIGKIKKKFGNLGQAELQDKLASAFGVGSSIASLLLDKTEQITEQIDKIGKIKNLDEAYAVSKITTDSWMRLSNILQNIKIAIGGQVLKKVEPFMQKIADLGQSFQKWLSTYKNIARWIGYAVGALIGFTGLTAALTLMSGVISAIGVAFSFLVSPVMLVIAAVIALGVIIYKNYDRFMEFIGGFITGFKLAGVSFEPLFSAFSLVWGALQKIGATIWRIMGLFSGASDSAYTFQQFGIDVGYALGMVFNIMLGAIELIAHGFNFMADIFAITTNALIEGWTAITTLWDSDKPIESFLNIAKALGNIFKNAFRGIVNSFVDLLNFIIQKANTLPSINIPLIPKWEDSALPQGNVSALGASIGSQALQMQNQIGALNTGKPKFELGEQVKPRLTKMPSGSVTKTLTQNQQTTKNINYGGVTINTNNGEKVWQELRNREQLAAG